MNILDAVIIVFLLIGALAGYRRGLIKQAVLLVGLIACLILSFYIRVPVSTFMYQHLPFINFGGIFKGISVLNILLYEVIAFLLVFSVLYLVLRILLGISGLIEKLLRATIILGFFSRIGGMIVGAIESYVIIFMILFVANLPFLHISGLEDSKYADKILTHTPVLSGMTGTFRKVTDEIEGIVESYKGKDVNFNEKTIEILIKYDIVSEDNIKMLKEKGKL